MSSNDCSIVSGTQAVLFSHDTHISNSSVLQAGTCRSSCRSCRQAGDVTHQKVIIYLSDISIVGWTHVKETQHWVLIFGLCLDGVVALDTLTGDGHMPVMSSDACRACLVCVCVCSATQALHKGLGTVLRPAFLHTQQSCCRAVVYTYIHVYIYGYDIGMMYM